MICFIIFVCLWLIIWFAFGIYLAWTERTRISFPTIIAMGFISLGIAMTFMVIVVAIVSCAFLLYLVCTHGL